MILNTDICEGSASSDIRDSGNSTKKLLKINKKITCFREEKKSQKKCSPNSFCRKRVVLPSQCGLCSLGNKQIHRHMDIANHRLNRPRGQYSKYYLHSCDILSCMT